ncbi:MAG: dihydrofolate reductase [Proteobacteria bacterium]|jgi:dihydrofolate reductase|nr:dihydrofolate reductase [Pseudomonadota bacterium]
MKTTLLVAWAEESNRLIGSKNGLPWKVPRDLKLFKERTSGQTVIFGLTTYENLPFKPLLYRVNIVVAPEGESGYTKYSCSIDGEQCLRRVKLGKVNEMFGTQVVFIAGVKEAVDFARQNYPERGIFICGGASIYKQALELDLVDEMLVSQIPGKYEGDTFFPEFPHMWDREIIEEYEGFVVERWTKETK